MKSFLLAAAIALPIALSAGMAATAPVEAHTSVRIFFGVPNFTSQVGPDYRYRRGYGWYRNYGYANSGKLSCAQAGRIVMNKGYRNVTARDCQGSTYVFRATRNGNRIQLIVNARTGAVWRG